MSRERRSGLGLQEKDVLPPQIDSLIPDKFSGLNGINRFLWPNGYRSNTNEAYRRDLRQFLKILHPEFDLTNPETFSYDWSKTTPEDIRHVLEVYNERNYKPSTIERKFASAKSFFNYLVAEGAVNKNPLDEIKSPYAKRNRFPRILNIDEVEKLKNIYSPEWSLIESRDQAILYLMLATGISPSELVNINVQDLNIEEKTVSIQNNKNQREVVFDTETQSLLKTYLSEIQGKLVRPGWEYILFPNRRGVRLTRSGVWIRLRELIDKSKIDNPEEVTPFTFRHTFAVHQLLKDVDPKALHKMLGFSRGVSSKVYSQILARYREQFPEDVEVFKILKLVKA